MNDELDTLKLALRFVKKTAEKYGLKNDNLIVQKKLVDAIARLTIQQQIKARDDIKRI